MAFAFKNRVNLPCRSLIYGGLIISSIARPNTAIDDPKALVMLSSKQENCPIIAQKQFFSSDQLDAIKTTLQPALADLAADKKSKLIAKTYFSLSKYVFELKKWPLLIFKAVKVDDKKTLEKYAQNKNRAQELIDKHSLNNLIIPHAELTYLKDIHGHEWSVIIEEKASICSTYKSSKNLYGSLLAHSQKNAHGFEFLKKLFAQIATFICLTGLSDIHANNIPLDTMGNGVVLLDLDEITYHTKNLDSAITKGIIGLLFEADLPFFSIIIEASAIACNSSLLAFTHRILTHLKSRYKVSELYEELLKKVHTSIERQRSGHELRFKGMRFLESASNFFNKRDHEELW